VVTSYPLRQYGVIMDKCVDCNYMEAVDRYGGVVCYYCTHEGMKNAPWRYGDRIPNCICCTPMTRGDIDPDTGVPKWCPLNKE